MHCGTFVHHYDIICQNTISNIGVQK